VGLGERKLGAAARTTGITSRKLRAGNEMERPYDDRSGVSGGTVREWMPRGGKGMNGDKRSLTRLARKKGRGSITYGGGGKRRRETDTIKRKYGWSLGERDWWGETGGGMEFFGGGRSETSPSGIGKNPISRDRKRGVGWGGQDFSPFYLRQKASKRRGSGDNTSNRKGCAQKERVRD